MPADLGASHRMVGLGVYLAAAWSLAWPFLAAPLLPLGTGMPTLLYCVPELCNFPFLFYKGLKIKRSS